MLPISRIHEMHELYQQGASLAAVGEAYDRTRQSVFELFKRHRLSVRQQRKPKVFVEFNGSKYTMRNHGYLMRTCEPRTLLHRDIWESVNGLIPDGWDVHHKDHNKLNNLIDNFECMLKADHTRLHSHGQNQHTKKKGVKCGA